MLYCCSPLACHEYIVLNIIFEIEVKIRPDAIAVCVRGVKF